MPSAWIRHPTVRGDDVVFSCEDDLFCVSWSGGVARRLTTGLGSAARPRFSPDGSLLAFDGTEEGVREIYVIDAQGGPCRRLTWHGESAQVVGWTEQGSVVFHSATGRPFHRDTWLYEVEPSGGHPRLLPFGPAVALATASDGRRALVRNSTDLAWWKGYRGGRIGALWLTGPDGAFRSWPCRFNLACPHWIGDRLFLIGDPDGVPQLMSFVPGATEPCSLDEVLRAHTTHDGLAVRFVHGDARRLVYTWGGDLFGFDPGSSEAPRRIEVEVRSQRTERQRRFVSAAKYLEDVDLHPEGHSLALTIRGQAYVLGNWEGPALRIGARDGGRSRLARWAGSEAVLLVCDRSGEEVLERYDVAGGEPRIYSDLGHARLLELAVSPTGTHAAYTEPDGSLTLLTLTDGAHRRLDESGAGYIQDLTWSADGRWLAWVRPESATGRTRVRMTSVDGEPFDVTDGDYHDAKPSFDPDGDHLYLLSNREFDPVMDSHVFAYAFPRGVRAYVVTLRAATPHPFQPAPRPLKRPKPDRRARPTTIEVDADGIRDRMVAFPIPEGRYDQILGVGHGTVLLTRAPLRGMLDRTWFDPGPPKSDNQVLVWDFDRQELTDLAFKVTHLFADAQREHVVARVGARLRVFQANLDKSQREELKRADGRADRKSGWIDLQRVRASVEPPEEWRQMLVESWRLVRDHFWRADLGGIDWPRMREQYESLLPRISTRSELSDLLWCLNGELETSHAYEMGGDVRGAPTRRIGRLGADFCWDAVAGGWQVVRLPRGDAGDRLRSSPLRAPGVHVDVGEVVVAVGGQPVSAEAPLERELVHQADVAVWLSIRGKDGGTRQVSVHTLTDDRPLRYRDWVLQNRERVHEASAGRAGYVHVPDMGPAGFAEFHRDFPRESERQALIVDVRFNRGGHVSQLLLDRLIRRRLGYSVPRWAAPRPYPAYSVPGPMLCLTNELAGSDGDIFSHAWKLLELGPLVGTRTWGGTVGIWPRHLLADRSVTTQPEFATWFTDVAFGVENYGTDPDVVVPFPPEAAARAQDPQLDEGLRLLLAALDSAPPSPTPTR